MQVDDGVGEVEIEKVRQGLVGPKFYNIWCVKFTFETILTLFWLSYHKIFFSFIFHFCPNVISKMQVEGGGGEIEIEKVLQDLVGLGCCVSESVPPVGPDQP